MDTAISGNEALSKLQQAADAYDIVLMDIQMPGMDGLETTERARKQLKLTDLPIIALTAGALLEERKRALNAGMNDFLTKPINPSKLIKVIRTCVEEYRGSNTPLNIAQPEQDSPDNQADADWPQIDGLNLVQAKRLLMEDKALFLTTLDSLLQQHGNLTDYPIEQLDNQEADTEERRLNLASQVHKLRSAAGMIGAERIQRLAAEAEGILRTPNAVASPLMAELAAALSALQAGSAEALSNWKDQTSVKTSKTTDALSLDDVQHLLTLLDNQDLAIIEALETLAAALTQALGAEGFNQLTGVVMQLDYQQAKAIITPLMKNNGATV